MGVVTFGRMGVEAWLDVDSIAKEHGWSCRVLEWSMVGCGYIENGVPGRERAPSSPHTLSGGHAYNVQK